MDETELRGLGEFVISETMVKVHCFGMYDWWMKAERRVGTGGISGMFLTSKTACSKSCRFRLQNPQRFPGPCCQEVNSGRMFAGFPGASASFGKESLLVVS